MGSADSHDQGHPAQTSARALPPWVGLNWVQTGWSAPAAPRPPRGPEPLPGADCSRHRSRGAQRRAPVMPALPRPRGGGDQVRPPTSPASRFTPGRWRDWQPIGGRVTGPPLRGRGQGGVGASPGAAPLQPSGSSPKPLLRFFLPDPGEGLGWGEISKSAYGGRGEEENCS